MTLHRSMGLEPFCVDRVRTKLVVMKRLKRSWKVFVLEVGKTFM
jgi:hypothetical protein